MQCVKVYCGVARERVGMHVVLVPGRDVCLDDGGVFSVRLQSRHSLYLEKGECGGYVETRDYETTLLDGAERDADNDGGFVSLDTYALQCGNAAAVFKIATHGFSRGWCDFCSDKRGDAIICGGFCGRHVVTCEDAGVNYLTYTVISIGPGLDN